MNYHSKTARLKEIFLGDLAGERFKKDPIPSALHLSELYAVSRNTIRRMLKELEAEGTLLRCSNNRFLRISTPKQADRENKAKTKLRLRTKRSVIGWFYSGSRDQLIVERTKGIERFVEENDLELRVVTSIHGHEPILDLLENIQDCGINGVIVANHPLPRYTETLNHLRDIHFPVVIACGQPTSSDMNVVAEDDFHGIYAATTYLLGTYDCPVYFLGGPGNIEERKEAYRQAMWDAGLGPEVNKRIQVLKPEMDAPQNWDMRQKMLLPGKLIRPFLSGLKLPVGIVCANDYIAFGVYEASCELGIKVGRDLLVTGFGDLPFAQRLNPPLTTIQVDYEKLGYQAAWLLYQQITGKISVPTRLSISTKLQKRSSC